MKLPFLQLPLPARRIWFDLIWLDWIGFDLIWLDLKWFDLIWFDLIWIELIWFDLICIQLTLTQLNASQHKSTQLNTWVEKDCMILGWSDTPWARPGDFLLILCCIFRFSGISFRFLGLTGWFQIQTFLNNPNTYKQSKHSQNSSNIPQKSKHFQKV